MNITIADHGINWVWYWRLDVQGDSVTVLAYNRLHRYEGEQHPDPSPNWMVLDKRESTDGKRTLLALRLSHMGNSAWLDVANPAYIFSYSGRLID